MLFYIDAAEKSMTARSDKNTIFNAISRNIKRCKKTVDGIKTFIGSMHNELEEMGINESGQRTHGTRRKGKGRVNGNTIRYEMLF